MIYPDISILSTASDEEAKERRTSMKDAAIVSF
jgi:hypothetical protein